MTEKQKGKLANDAADRFYELLKQKQWVKVFIFRGFAVTVERQPACFALGIYTRDGDYVTNIAA